MTCVTYEKHPGLAMHLCETQPEISWVTRDPETGRWRYDAHDGYSMAGVEENIELCPHCSADLEREYLLERLK